MRRAVGWLRSGSLIACSVIAIAAAVLCVASFPWSVVRITQTTTYRPINETEMRRVADGAGTPPLLALATMPADEQRGKIAAVQVQLTWLTLANGGFGYASDTFPAVSYGQIHQDAGSPRNATVREVWVGSGSYPRVMLPKSSRIGASWCGVGRSNRPPYPAPNGPEGYWTVVVPLPLIVLVAAPWPLIRLRGALRARRVNRLPGFELITVRSQHGAVLPATASDRRAELTAAAPE